MRRERLVRGDLSHSSNRRAISLARCSSTARIVRRDPTTFFRHPDRKDYRGCQAICGAPAALRTSRRPNRGPACRRGPPPGAWPGRRHHLLRPLGAGRCLVDRLSGIRFIRPAVWSRRHMTWWPTCFCSPKDGAEAGVSGLTPCMSERVVPNLTPSKTLGGVS